MDKKEQKKQIKETLDALIKYKNDNEESSKNLFCSSLSTILTKLVKESAVGDKYNVVVLYDEGRLIRSDADKIYKAITQFTENRPILLILYSRGGYSSTAYLIGKMCREYSPDGEFIVVVPRMAKSAATIICCAAETIHMGALSELGPVDPQIDGLPALGLKNAVEQMAQLVESHPGASQMFAQYLHDSLPVINLGYYERVAESSMQYVERLLDTHTDLLKKGKTSQSIAKELVYKYKDHGFVIDKTEAVNIFGDKIVKTGTEEYKLGNEVYQLLNGIYTLADFMGFSFHYIGSTDSGVYINKRQEN